jgi:hypothetical protein
MNRLNSTRHSFELFRIDFLIDEDMDPHITEVNMSPGLTPGAPAAQKFSYAYEQIVYNTLNIIGAGTKIDLMAE